MTVASTLKNGFNNIVAQAGQVCKIRYYSYFVGSVWDDETALTESMYAGSELFELYASGDAIVTGTYVLSGALYLGSTYPSTQAGSNYFVNCAGSPEWGIQYWPYNPYNSYVIDPLPVNVNLEPIWKKKEDPTQIIGSYGPVNPPLSTGSLVLTGSWRPISAWVSGIILPVNVKEGTSDFIMMQQGKLAPTDLHLFISGNTILAGSNLITKIQLGSPNGEQYAVVNEATKYNVSDTSIFKKAYIRRLTNGSLIGE